MTFCERFTNQIISWTRAFINPIISFMKSFSPKQLLFGIVWSCIMTIGMIFTLMFLKHIIIAQETCSIESEIATPDWRYLGRSKPAFESNQHTHTQIADAPKRYRKLAPQMNSWPNYVAQIEAFIDTGLKKTNDQILTELHDDEMSSVSVMIVLAPKQQHKEDIRGSDHTEFKLAASVENGDIILPQKQIPVGQSIEQQSRKLLIDIIGEHDKDIHLFYAHLNEQDGIDATVMLFVDEEQILRGKYKKYRFWIDDTVKTPNNVVLDRNDGFKKPKIPRDPKDLRRMMYKYLSRSIVISSPESEQLQIADAQRTSFPVYIDRIEPIIDRDPPLQKTNKKILTEPHDDARSSVSVMIVFAPKEQRKTFIKGSYHTEFELAALDKGDRIELPNGVIPMRQSIEQQAKQLSIDIIGEQNVNEIHLFYARLRRRGGIEAIVMLFVDEKQKLPVEYKKYRFWIDDTVKAPSNVVLDEKLKNPTNPKNLRQMMYHLSKSIVISSLFPLPGYIGGVEEFIDPSLEMEKTEIFGSTDTKNNVQVMAINVPRAQTVQKFDGHDYAIYQLMAKEADDSLLLPEGSPTDGQTIKETAFALFKNTFGNGEPLTSVIDWTQTEAHLFHAKKNEAGGIDAMIIFFVISKPAEIADHYNFYKFGIPQIAGDSFRIIESGVNFKSEVKKIINTHLSTAMVFRKPSPTPIFAIPNYIELRPTFERSVIEEQALQTALQDGTFKCSEGQPAEASLLVINYEDTKRINSHDQTVFKMLVHRISVEIEHPGKGYYGLPSGGCNNGQNLRIVLQDRFVQTAWQEKEPKFDENDFHLIHAKKAEDGKVYAQYALFIRGENEQVPGPDEEHKREVMRNKRYEMTKENGYHAFIPFGISDTQDFEFTWYEEGGETEDKFMKRKFWNKQQKVFSPQLHKAITIK